MYPRGIRLNSGRSDDRELSANRSLKIPEDFLNSVETERSNRRPVFTFVKVSFIANKTPADSSGIPVKITWHYRALVGFVSGAVILLYSLLSEV